MTLAIILVIVAALALVFILGVTLSRSLQPTDGPSLQRQIQLIDVAAFRSLMDPAEDDYLRSFAWSVGNGCAPWPLTFRPREETPRFWYAWDKAL
jgi:hypothetical protein